MKDRNVVEVITDKELRENVQELNGISERLRLVKINLGNRVINIINTYAPLKVKYWDSFNLVVGACNRTEK